MTEIYNNAFIDQPADRNGLAKRNSLSCNIEMRKKESEIKLFPLQKNFSREPEGYRSRKSEYKKKHLICA